MIHDAYTQVFIPFFLIFLFSERRRKILSCLGFITFVGHLKEKEDP